jgi:hypothetical protein
MSLILRSYLESIKYNLIPSYEVIRKLHFNEPEALNFVLNQIEKQKDNLIKISNSLNSFPNKKEFNAPLSMLINAIEQLNETSDLFQQKLKSIILKPNFIKNNSAIELDSNTKKEILKEKNSSSFKEGNKNSTNKQTKALKVKK